MHVAPQRPAQLRGCHNLAGMRHKQAERGKFLGWYMNHGFSAQKNAVRFQMERSKDKAPLPNFCRRDLIGFHVPNPLTRNCCRGSRLPRPAGI
jgi:hypothetical protein